jgi:prophage regulatory protein
VTTHDLPRAADRFLPKPEVLRIAGFSAATLWREVKAGRFPAPVSISPNRIGFLESEVRAWIAARLGSRTTAPCEADDREARAA